MRGGKRAGAGRPKGSSNKITKDVRSAIQNAFETLGGEDYLVQVGRDNPTTFCKLLGHILPKEITGADGGPLTVQVLQFADHTNPQSLAPPALPAPAVELSRAGRQEV